MHLHLDLGVVYGSCETIYGKQYRHASMYAYKESWKEYLISGNELEETKHGMGNKQHGETTVRHLMCVHVYT